MKNISLKIILLVMVVSLVFTACTPAEGGQGLPAAEDTTSNVSQGNEVSESEESGDAANTEEDVQAEPIEVVDALGRTVVFETPPTRIVLAGRAVIMVADAMYVFPQASERLVAISKISQGEGNFTKAIDPDYDTKEVIDHNIGAEQLAAVKPDLVVLKSFMAETLGNPLDELGIPVVYVDFETQEQFYRDMKVLGLIFQNEERAEEVINFYSDKVNEITALIPDRSDEEKSKVLLLYYSDKDGEIAFNIPPLSWIQTSLVEEAGGIPVWKDAELGKGWTKVNLEQIAAWNPDQIHIISYFEKSDTVIDRLLEDPQWQVLSAVKNDQLYAFPADYYSWDQPDTRWILGLTYLAAQLNPDAFAGLDIENEVKTFYSEIYGLDETQIKEIIMPVLQGSLP